jgi:hypothetical protein
MNSTNSVQRDPNFSTQRDSDKERERVKDEWTDRQVDRHDVAFRNFVNASTLSEGDVLSFHSAVKEMAAHAVSV